MNKKFRVAVVGCGKISNRHFSAIVKNDSAELVAAVDLDEKVLDSKCSKWKINSKSRDLEYLTDLVKPDIVHVCTPPQSHFNISKTLLDSGIKNLFIEKPFSFRLDELNTLYSYKDSHIFCNHNVLQNDCILEINNFLEKKNIKIKAMEILWSIPDFGNLSSDDWTSNFPSGIIVNHITHPLSIASFFSGGFKEFKVLQSIVGSNDSWQVSIDGFNFPINLSIRMTKYSNEKKVKIYSDNYRITCNVQTGKLRKYNFISNSMKNIISDINKDIIYNIKDIFSIPIDISRKLFKERPGISRNVNHFYNSIVQGRKNNHNYRQNLDCTKIIECIILKSKFN